MIKICLIEITNFRTVTGEADLSLETEAGKTPASAKQLFKWMR